MSRRGVLLDRDGTIIVDSGYVGSVDDVVFLDGAVEAIARLNAAGIPVAVVTNQAGVARGMYELADVDLVHKHMTAELAAAGARVDLWLFCPYHPDGVVSAFSRWSADRKPGPGMAQAAAAALDLDLASSWVVGDSDCDVGLARGVGARAFLIDPSGAPTDQGHAADNEARRVPTLAAAVDAILVESGTEGPVGDFPTRRYPSAPEFARGYSRELERALASIDHGQLQQAADLLAAAYRADRAVFACGNGGSASIANHFQCDHVKGVRVGTGMANRVTSLSTNIEIMSAIANDIGYEAVFEYQLESQARNGDVLVVVSSSGRSPNIVRALDWAREHGMPTVALTGFGGGPARALADVSVHVSSSNYGVVEDAHQACMHLLAQYVRQSLMSDADVAGQVF
jgi:histidinol-phosphate phosphatase family protein